MVRKLLETLVLLGAVIPINVLAADYFCVGRIDKVTVSGEGLLAVLSAEAYGDGEGRTVCSVHTNYKGIESTICKSWLALMLSNQAMGRNIQIQYAEDGFNCANHPSWQGASVPKAVYAQSVSGPQAQ